MAPITSFAAPFGARLAHALPKRQLEIAFGVFLWLIALRFIVEPDLEPARLTDSRA